MGTIEPYVIDGGRRYRVRYRTPDRRQTSKRGFLTKRSAEQFLATVEVAQMRGEWIDPSRSRVTVRAMAEEWYSGRIQVKPTTLSGYRHYLDKHILPRWGDVPITAVTHGDVQVWVNQLRTRLGPSMVRQVHFVLSGVYKYAIRDGRASRNPAADVGLPRIQRKKRGYLTHSQVRALSELCREDGDLVLFLAYTGLRWGEAAALRVESVNFVRRRVEVDRAVSEPRGEIVWGSPKSHERRSVPFPEFLEAELRRRCLGKSATSLLFPTSFDQVLRSGNFRSRTFDRAVKAAMDVDPLFPKVTVHDLRHTAASLAISAGANVKAVQRMLGHASAAMTLDVYADLFEDDLDAVAFALNERASLV